MAGARGRLRKSAESAARRRSPRRTRPVRDTSDVPDVFQDLLFQEQASQADSRDVEDARPPKKRKTLRQTAGMHTSPLPNLQLATQRQIQRPPAAPSQALSTSRVLPSQPRTQPLPPNALSDSEAKNIHARQTIIDSDESDDSDVEWEDALGEDNDAEGDDTELEIGDVSITFGNDIGQTKEPKKQVRRRAITSVDKKRRLDIHKVHVLCLLYHAHRRNAWCNDERVQAILRKIPSPKTLSNLVPNPEYSQYQTSKRFMDGMNELKLMWSKRFNVSAQGMYRPRWAEADAEVRPFSDFDELDDPMDHDDFRTAAMRLEGSQDLGEQLFCALLRGIGIDARLVCSLQCLPFASAAQPSTPQKPSTQKNTIVLDPYNAENISPSKPRGPTSSRASRPSRLERAIGERHPVLKPGVALKQKKAYRTPYPVYWIEAFNAAHQKWIPIDPLSTFTVNAPEKLEPPLSFAQNSLVYAVAFDDDYTAKDVTRRYAKAYNAKTRKFRVESTPHGDKWWGRTMKFFIRSPKLDRDQVEDAALDRKEASEGIPKNVQDFKNHPVYVLERHLRYNEVIHPLTQVGKVNVGTSMNPKMESIYRRRDVHVVRSADKWYRLGRDLIDGEQPLKHGKAKKGRRLSIGPDMDMEDPQDEIGVALYAQFQTELYVPPPVIRGRVPRNAFGNLDLYVPSMCPPGGTHIRHKQASKAARIVGIDYAEAVTGFSFKGRHGTAIVQGVVVAQEYAEAVEAVIDAMEYAQEEAENYQRRAEALHLWRRFYLGLRIAQRVNAIEIDGETGPAVDIQEEIARQNKALTEKALAGGFFPEVDGTIESTAQIYEPPASQYPYGRGLVADEDDAGDGGYATNEDENSHREEPHNFGSSILSQQQLQPRRTRSFGGGFLVEKDEDDGGGFSRELSLPDPSPSTQNVHREGVFMLDTESMRTSDGGFMLESEPAKDHGGGFIPNEIAVDEVAKDAVQELPHVGEKIQIGRKFDRNEPISVPASPIEVRNTDIHTSQKRSVPSSSPSDVGSLPLEDPEDSDADPDWLVEAT